MREVIMERHIADKRNGPRQPASRIDIVAGAKRGAAGGWNEGILINQLGGERGRRQHTRTMRRDQNRQQTNDDSRNPEDGLACPRVGWLGLKEGHRVYLRVPRARASHGTAMAQKRTRTLSICR